MIGVIGLADKVTNDLHLVAFCADHAAFAGHQQQALSRRRPFIDGAKQTAPPHQVVWRIVGQLGLDVLLDHDALTLLAFQQLGHLPGIQFGQHQHQHQHQRQREPEDGEDACSQTSNHEAETIRYPRPRSVLNHGWPSLRSGSLRRRLEICISMARSNGVRRLPNTSWLKCSRETT